MKFIDIECPNCQSAEFDFLDSETLDLENGSEDLRYLCCDCESEFSVLKEVEFNNVQIIKKGEVENAL